LNNIKSINGLIKYLREKHHIQIKGSNHKKQLKNVGYYHRYKGYRYIKKPNNRIKFNNFDEILSIIDFDKKIIWIFIKNLHIILLYYIIYTRIAAEVFGRRLGEVDL